MFLENLYMGQILLYRFEFNFLPFGIDFQVRNQLLDPVPRFLYLDRISLSVHFFILTFVNTFKVWIEIFAEKLGDVAGLGPFPNGNSLPGWAAATPFSEVCEVPFVISTSVGSPNIFSQTASKLKLEL